MPETPNYGFLSTLSLRRATCGHYQPLVWANLFLSTLSLRRATCNLFAAHRPNGQFLSTLSLRRATLDCLQNVLHIPISIHALLAESDATTARWTASLTYFYPRSPCGERQRRRGRSRPPVYFYPRSPCGERQLEQENQAVTRQFLSTLSLRRATLCLLVRFVIAKISIHALLAESDACSSVSSWPLYGFLSTLSLRRATRPRWGGRRAFLISIHALLAESDRVSYVISGWIGISIHALLAESDPDERATTFVINEFLSTLSLRRATKACRTWTYERLISIHALLAESDGASSKYMSYGWDFYPRSPCGERRSAADLPRPVQDFYPRSPCGERHLRVLDGSKSSIISIHALLAESDSFAPKPKTKATISIHALLAESDVSMRIDMGNNIDFYPRSPCGERRRGCWAMLSPWPISIHALLAESDKLTARQSGRLLDFYPRSPCGERRLGWEV